MPHAQPRSVLTLGEDLPARYAAVRALSQALAAPLSDADATIQSMEDASPAKWHLAHTTWFWETFLLRDHAEGYALYDENWPFVFNSYYETEGERIARFSRGMLSRPTLSDIVEWRSHVDAAMNDLLGREELAPLIELGLSHEQQHQELLLTDIKHALFQNPLGVKMWDVSAAKAHCSPNDWHSHPGGIADRSSNRRVRLRQRGAFSPCSPRTFRSVLATCHEWRMG